MSVPITQVDKQAVKYSMNARIIVWCPYEAFYIFISNKNIYVFKY